MVVTAKRGVGHVSGLQRCILSHSHKSQVKKIHEVLSQQADLAVYHSPFWFGHSPFEFTKMVKELKLMAQTRGIRIHQYLDDWLLRAPCQETCRHHTQTLLTLCRDLGRVAKRNQSSHTSPSISSVTSSTC